MRQAVSARGEAVRRGHRRRGGRTLQKGVWQTMGNHGTAKLWELRYSSPYGGTGEAEKLHGENRSGFRSGGGMLC